MVMYSAHVEVRPLTTDRKVEQVTQRMMEELADFHPSVGVSQRGHLDAQISLAAETLRAAAATAIAVVSAAAGGADPVACEVMTEDEFFAREGFEPIPELIGTSDAAKLLGVSRQRVLQMVDEGKLPSTKVGGGLVIPLAAVEAKVPRKADCHVCGHDVRPGAGGKVRWESITETRSGALRWGPMVVHEECRLDLVTPLDDRVGVDLTATFELRPI